MEGLIAREIELARELLAAKRRERALLALRKKKLREGQLEQIDAYLLNVEQVLLLHPLCMLACPCNCWCLGVSEHGLPFQGIVSKGYLQSGLYH